ncbi:MAG: Flp pilus assembly complex ATPase component TadA [Chloroflexi bacterium]|nr:Flp pilus assembly complex ATPase component TadA [Chloroflexota bacterium]
MSLMQRVERAQQRSQAIAAAEAAAVEAAAAAANGPGPAEAAELPKSSSATTGIPVMGGGPAADVAPAAMVPVMEPQSAPLLPRTPAREAMLLDIRHRLVAEVITAFDTLLDAEATDVRAKVEAIVDRTIGQNGYAVTRDERTRLVDELADDVTGFGPLEPLLNDETITEVMVNGPSHVYIERAGKIERVNSAFLNNEHVLRIIDRIITPMGRRIDEMSPRVDARLPDGSRVNAIVEPLSLVGPVITVRKFSQTPYTVDDLIRFGTATPEMFEFLRVCIEARLNLFVSGGTGSGKTTTLNVLSSFIPNDERIVTIEDAAELQLRQDHVITLESRPPNLEGEGEITIRQLLKNAMHMRPDRIIVGECRSGEALDMLQAMTTGHDGSLSTGHANTPKDMLRRLETMVLMTGYQLPLRAIREQMASAVDLIVHTSRLKDGSRRIVNITEVYGIEDDEILTQDIFAFEQTGVRDGKIEGMLAPTGVRPTFMDQFRKAGITLPPGDYGIPAEDKAKPTRISSTKGRWGAGDSSDGPVAPILPLGYGKAVKAGGMVYISAIGPVDPDSGQVVGSTIKAQARQCLANLKGKLESSGTSIDKVVWANWSLRDATEFDLFNEEWVKVFPGDGPVGQSTMMTPLQRRAGFRLSIGVIAEA